MSHTLEKYEILLDKLVDDKLIMGYDDNCRDDINFSIRFRRGELDKLTDANILKMFKLEESTTEIFSTLDENNKLKIFESTVEIIEYFVKFRLEYYHKRKKLLITNIQRDLKILSNRGKFIKYILDGKIIVNNVPKTTIIEKLVEIGLSKNDDSYDYLLRMPIYSLTKELYEKLKLDFTYKKEELEKITNTDPQDMYIDDLKELKKKFK